MILQGLRAGLVATLTLTSAATLHAQVVSNPQVVEFDPSPDHLTVLGNGQPAVSRYDLEVYVVGASVPFVVVNMGKLAPQQDGKSRFNFSSIVASWPLPGGTYEARVRAVGPDGTGLSTPSNPFNFTLQPPCGAFSLLADEHQRERRRRCGDGDGDRHHGLRADRHEQRQLDHGDGRRDGHWQRRGVVECGGQYGHGAHGHGDHRRPDLQRHAGRGERAAPSASRRRAPAWAPAAVWRR